MKLIKGLSLNALIPEKETPARIDPKILDRLNPSRLRSMGFSLELLVRAIQAGNRGSSASQHYYLMAYLDSLGSNPLFLEHSSFNLINENNTLKISAEVVYARLVRDGDFLLKTAIISIGTTNIESIPLEYLEPLAR